MIYPQNYLISQVIPYIHWGYFLHAWGFPFRFAEITKVHDCEGCRTVWISSLPESEQGKAREANTLLQDARKLLQEWSHQMAQTHFRVRLLEAYGDGDDIYLPELNRSIPLLRQQSVEEGQPCLCLSDFLRPRNQGIADRVGLFASTVDADLEHSFPEDEYRHLLAQTLSDRLAEATAELGHLQTRREWWGFAPDENLTLEELFQEKYQGKRPAVGYPSLPDQSINFLIDELIDMKSLGINLTETGAMQPHASTSGFIFAHPATRHFSVGKIGDDQLYDYAQRRNLPKEWLKQFIGGL
ncbi:MAG: vitamin B12 dependent-methionine synthase activation domain-containing protein [Bacteroidaceae bacterium]